MLFTCFSNVFLAIGQIVVDLYYKLIESLVSRIVFVSAHKCPLNGLSKAGLVQRLFHKSETLNHNKYAFQCTLKVGRPPNFPLNK